MEKEALIEILNDWNFWSKTQYTGISREDYQKKIISFLTTNQAIIVSGVRRSGKSTILLQVAEKLIGAGVSPKNILIVNFEDYRLDERSITLLSEIYELFITNIAGKGQKYIFFDEIQVIKGWERFVRTVIDKKEAKIIISGSNSKLISKELGVLLTGRHINIEVFPPDFKEFLRFKGITVKTDIELAANKTRILKSLDSFVRYGSFPEIALLTDYGLADRLLLDYLDSIVNMDVVERYKIREKQKIKSILKFYMSNIANPVSFNKVKNWLSLPLRTVERFSYYLEEAYLTIFIKKLSFKVKEQEKSPRKIYAIDQGLANAYGFVFMENKSKLLENIVLLELYKRGEEVYYWSEANKMEVDFIVKRKDKINELIQASYDIKNGITKDRETRALLSASKNLHCYNLRIITWDYEAEEKIKGKKIKFVPLWKWLLNV